MRGASQVCSGSEELELTWRQRSGGYDDGSSLVLVTVTDHPTIATSRNCVLRNPKPILNSTKTSHGVGSTMLYDLVEAIVILGDTRDTEIKHKSGYNF